MLNQVKSLPLRMANGFRIRRNSRDVRASLIGLERALVLEWTDQIQRVTVAPVLDLELNEDLQSAIEDLTDTCTAVRRLRRSRLLVTPEQASAQIAERIATTKLLLRPGFLTTDAGKNVAARTLNLLFAGEQVLRREFVLEPRMVTSTERARQSTRIEPSKSSVVMQLRTSMIFQLRHSLFPEERMMVGAGRRENFLINIEALFDVTGAANRGGVKADPDKLGPALIAMSQTGTHFALWVHSHPGRGPGATKPSEIDLRQHADWLRDYSTTLVSAIVVADGYIRFWGKAVENGSVDISLSGEGMSVVSGPEHIYRLEV